METDGDDSKRDRVIDLLLASSDDASVATSNVADETDAVDASDVLSVATVTLSDGTTALLQEGQAVQLEDGTTAFIQAVADKTEGGLDAKFVDGQAVQLEDGTTAFIHATPKEGLQAVQLEDGSTAYIATAADTLFARDGLDLDRFGDAESHVLGKDELGRIQSLGASARISSARAIALGDKAFRCTFDGCGRLYTTHHHLKVHERSHTGDRPFKCDGPGCGKAFATGYGLKSHRRVHTGEKPYKCPDDACDKAFKTSGDLQKHVRTHTGERPFRCPFEGCDRAFTTSNIRKVHIRTHTGERPYICQEDGCGRSFASATNYKNHIRIHTGEKPYVCMVQGCGKRFTEYSSLYKHHVVHTHTKPYVCNFCGKNYRQTSTLAMHKRTSHGIVDAAEDGELLATGDEEEECDAGMDSMPKRRCIKIEGDDGGIANLVIQGTTQQVMLTGTTLMTDDAALAALHAAQRATHRPSSGDASLVSAPQILVVTDPSQLVALQLAPQHLGDVLPAAVVGKDPTVTGESVDVVTSAADGVAYVTE